MSNNDLILHTISFVATSNATIASRVEVIQHLLKLTNPSEPKSTEKTNG